MRRSKHYNDYPASVSELTEKLLSVLEDEKFFLAEGADYDITFKRFADSCLNRWISGEDLENIPEDEFSNILNLSIIQSDLNGLAERGVLDVIEDENGEDKYFLTEKGKKEVENFWEFNKNIKNEQFDLVQRGIIKKDDPSKN